ncbi:hypothetical protein [Cutibacterium avidum]|uniref:hypothetical protein n=1 Tax=Cutibacterium avidum TaxID=33010 RepID=UPI0005655496|nr:hypothetical protein [Cutibacterium avidum]MDQ9043823.1 hypothetical protein [Cutibacterium avidum]MDQ9049569.1 hypothetical protein [Cutibacterium avidum]MDQ9074863.1 hypothetical protein [Cutibacterium avidum]MDU1588845.1 hypothetical protein [Cutibacterium avidum]MDU2313209.1 hypothetical protein [Cutibacterium avidum]
MMTRLGASVKLSFSVQLMTVLAGVEDDEADGEDFSVEEPAQALMGRAHSPARAAAAARVARPARRMDMVFSFIVVD